MKSRGTSNGNSTGSSYDRRARRNRLWKKHAYRVTTYSPATKRARTRCVVFCRYCRKQLGKREFEVDRIVCGHDGGRYVDGNIAPACSPCNRNKCAKICKKGVAAKTAERFTKPVRATRAVAATTT